MAHAQSIQTGVGFCRGFTHDVVLQGITRWYFYNFKRFSAKYFISNTDNEPHEYVTFEKYPHRLRQCGGCVSKGEAALKGVPGVEEATINLATSIATVTLSGEGTHEGQNT